MKNKISALGLALLMSVSVFSCGKENNSENVSSSTETKSAAESLNVPFGGKPSKEEYRKMQLAGSQEEVDYESLVNGNGIAGGPASFISPQNPLQLKEGTDENAYIVKPYKIAIIDDNSVLGIQNVWNFPVACESGRYIGIMTAHCNIDRADRKGFGGSQGCAPALNEALENGKLAVFNDGTWDCLYGIYEDDTVINLRGDEPYSGNLTFDVINQGVNLITLERINEKVEIDSDIYNTDTEFGLIE